MTKKELEKLKDFIRYNCIYRVCFFSSKLGKEVVIADRISTFYNEPDRLRLYSDGIFVRINGEYYTDEIFPWTARYSTLDELFDSEYIQELLGLEIEEK